VKRPKRFPQPVGDILASYFQKKGWDEKLREYQIWTHWPKVMGKNLSDRCRPLRLKYGVLTIGVSSSTWLTQLQFMKLELIEKIKNLFGIRLTDIRFKTDTPPVEHSES